MSHKTPASQETPPVRPARAPSRRDPPRSHRVRRWLPYVAAAALLALILAGFRPQPLAVESAAAATRPLRASVNEEGRTRIRQRYTVAAPVVGHLRRIALKAGDGIDAAGTVVAVLDPIAPVPLDARSRALAEARLESARAQLEKADATHRFAETDLRRFEKLRAERTISQQELDSFQWRETAAARDLATARSSVRQAEAELAAFAAVDPASPAGPPIEIKSPAAGRVLRVFQESARVVSAGTPLLEIGDPDALEAVIEVLSRDGAAIPVGARVELDQWGGGKPIEARVRLVEPAAFTKVSALGVEEKRVNVIADIITPPEARRGLGDDFRVDARIFTWENPAVLTVPAGALFRHGSQWAAYAIVEGRARFRTLAIGRSNGRETEIMDGLKPGEEVILYPGDRVREGQAVRIIQVGRDGRVGQ